MNSKEPELALLTDAAISGTLDLTLGQKFEPSTIIESRRPLMFC